MRSAALALVAIAALGGAARAGNWLAPPDGWHADAAQGKDVADQAGSVSHFGGATAVAAAQVYEPGKPGVVLYAIMVSAGRPDDPAAAARAEVDELHDTVKRAALAGSGVGEDSWQDKVDAAGKLIDARLSWHDAGSGTKQSERLVIASDGATIVALTGQCIAASDADPVLFGQCEAALGTLDPGIDPAKRVALSLAAEGAAPVAPAAGAPQLETPPRPPIGPIPVAPAGKPTTDPRPVVIGIALVALAAVFWWNNRRRERYAKESTPR